jgi:hypothetical protein
MNIVESNPDGFDVLWACYQAAFAEEERLWLAHEESSGEASAAAHARACERLCELEDEVLRMRPRDVRDLARQAQIARRYADGDIRIDALFKAIVALAA